MPRGKLLLKLVDDPKKRKCMYRKRIRGLKQKTYELSTLCGVDAFMLSFGPSAEAEAWPENRQQIRDAIARYSGPKTADSRNRNMFSEALESRLRKVRERIELLTKQRGLAADTEELVEEEIFSWMDLGEEGITCDGIPRPTDTGLPQFPPELFSSESTGDGCDGWEEVIAAVNGGVRESVEPYVELTDLVSWPPTDTGFSQLSSEPCLDVSGVSQVASSDHDLQSLGPFDSNLTRTLGGLPQPSSEECFDDVSDITGINFSPSGLGDGHDSGLLGQNSSELFASDWPADDVIGYYDQHYFTNGPMNCSYDDLEDVGSQPCRLWTF